MVARRFASQYNVRLPPFAKFVQTRHDDFLHRRNNDFFSRLIYGCISHRAEYRDPTLGTPTPMANLTCSRNSRPCIHLYMIGRRTIQSFLTSLMTLHPRIIFMLDGKNGISFPITNKPLPELVSQAFIVHPPLRNKLTIDISYRKCSGTIIG